jgi:hypothetical protein
MLDWKNSTRKGSIASEFEDQKTQKHAILKIKKRKSTKP